MAAADGSEIEEEIRFALPDRATPETILKALQPQAEGGVQDRSYRDRYLDHPEFRLLARGQALRLRTLADRSWIEIKGSGFERDGVWLRPEWRQPVAPDWSGAVQELNPGPVRDRLVEFCSWDARLIPILSGEIQRRVVRLILPQGVVTELALDQGEMRAAERQIAIHELELEWRSGSREAWRAWAGTLAKQYGLAPAPHSKFAQGLSLLHRSVPLEGPADPNQAAIRQGQPLGG